MARARLYLYTAFSLWIFEDKGEDGRRMEGEWKEDRRRIEGGWKEDGRRMEGVWREDGERM